MKEFNLKLTEHDIQIIGMGLGEVAYKFAGPLLQKIQQQINEQSKEEIKE